MARSKRKKEEPMEDNNGTVTTLEPPPPAESAPAEGGEDKRQPVFKVGPIPTASGESVEAAVWDKVVTTRDNRTFTVYSVTVHASYRDEQGTWHRTQSFRGGQLYALLYCLQRASDWICAQRDPQQQACPF